MKDYTENTPVFSPKIQITETTDPGHADNINAAPMQLLQNTLCNKKSIEDLQKSTGVTDTSGYSTETKYFAGEYCMYNNILYKCTGDTQGEWDPGCWVQTNPIEEIKGLQKSIGSLEKLFRTDDEGNMKPLGAAAFAEIANNRTTTEAGFLADARQLKEIQDQLDEQNSASVFNYLGNIQVIENTDSSTRTFSVPDKYSGVFIQFYGANVESDFGYISADNIGCVLEIKKGTETANFRLDVSTHVLTITIPNKTAYQKTYGNYFNFWGVR